ncbi:MAG: hypothetical protein U5K69_18285 [Balneolaceae bacterium]|nr:hypothetical protein [Balneolaceae bacterium]
MSEDIIRAANSDATIAILMGMRKLPKISMIFKDHGRGATPVAVIQKGSLPEEKIVLGTIDTIVEEVENKGLTNPALILIGEVVRLHPDFCDSLSSKNRLPFSIPSVVKKSYKEISTYLKVGVAAFSI